MSRFVAAAALLPSTLFLWADAPVLRYAFGSGGLHEASFGLMMERGVYPCVLAAALLIVLAAAGRRALALLLRGEKPSALLALALGAGAYGTALFFLGLCGLMSPRPVAAATALFAAAGDWRGSFSHERMPPKPRGLATALLAGILAYAAFHGLICALAPATDADVLAYHLALPRLYVQAGRISEIPWLLHSHWPHLIEVLYCAPLLLKTDAAASLLHLAGAAALIAAVFASAKDWLDESTAWLAAAVLAVQPVLSRFAGTARVDAWWALFHFLACVELWRWRLDGKRARLAAAGALAGLAAATKLLELIPLATLGLWILSRPKPPARRLADAGLFFLCALAPAAPWYLKTWLGAGNPVWPFLSSIFGDRLGAAAFLPSYLQANRWPHPLSLVSLLRYDPQLLLVPLALAALLYFAGRPRNERFPGFLAMLLATSAPYALVIAPHFEAWRLLLPVLPALALTFAWCATSLARRGRAARGAAAALCVAALSPVLRLSQNNELFAVLELRSSAAPGEDPRALYLARTLDHYAFFQRVNAALANERGPVLLFPEQIGYYLDFPYEWGDPVYQGVIPYASLETPERLSERLRELGITHVLAAPASAAGQSGRAAGLMTRLLERDGDKLMSDRDYSLYRLRRP